MKHKTIVEKYGAIQDASIASIIKTLFTESTKYDSMVLTELSCESIYKYIRHLEHMADK